MFLAQLLGNKLSTPEFDTNMGTIACWVAALLVLVLGFLKLASLPVSETQLFFGLLLVLTVGLLGICLGFLIQIANGLRK